MENKDAEKKFQFEELEKKEEQKEEIKEEKKETSVEDIKVVKEPKIEVKKIKDNSFKKKIYDFFWYYKKQVIVITVLIAGILFTSLVIGFGAYNIFSSKKAPVLSYKDAKDQSQKLYEEQELIKKYQAELDAKKEKTEEEKASEPKKSKLYEEYENLSDEEKKDIDAIPREEEVPIEDIDDIIKDQDKKDEEIPSRYSLADHISLKTEDQGGRGLCWAFASLNSLETFLSLRYGKDYDFSEQHINYITSNLLYGYRSIDDGGSFSLFTDYVMRSGVVLEEDVPYDKDYGSDEYSKFIDMKTIEEVTKTVEFPTITKQYNDYTDEELNKFRTAVKRHIMTNGSIYASISAYGNGSVFFFQGEGMIPNYYVSKENPNHYGVNHAISIIGWDDSYSKENFSDSGNVPEHDGAYIAFNSWGNTYKVDGSEEYGPYFYISYDDIFVEANMSGVTSTTINEDSAVPFEDIHLTDLKSKILQKYYYSLKEFDNKKYVTDLAFSKITDILIDHETDYIDEIHYLSNLRVLRIINSNVANLDIIPSNVKEKITSLVLTNDNISNIDFISDFINVGYINLDNNNIEDISPLSNLSKINSLTLNNNPVTDLSSLSNNSIYSLNVSNCPNIQNYGTIKSLGYLDISNCNLDHLESLDELKSLNRLTVSGNSIRDYSALNSLYQIKKEAIDDGYVNSSSGGVPYVNLSVGNSNIDDITIFNDLYVSGLNLDNNNISSLDGFHPAEVLSQLTLSNNKITSLENFNMGDYISTLTLSDNSISDIQSFVPGSALRALYLDNNKIKDVSPLSDYNINLNYLSLSGNKKVTGYGKVKVTNIVLKDCDLTEIESLNDTIRSLNFSNNNISDISIFSNLAISSLSIANNQSTLSGTLSSDSLESLHLENNKLDKNMKIIAPKIYSISLSDLSYNLDNLKINQNCSITYNNVELSLEELLNYPDDRHIYIDSTSKITADVYMNSNHEIDLSKLFGSNKISGLNVNSGLVGLSKDNKKLIVLDDDINEILISGTFGNRYAPVHLNVKSGLFGSIHDLFHSFRKILPF